MADLDTKDVELTAIGTVLAALRGLPDDDARQRVLEYAASRLALTVFAARRSITDQLDDISESADGASEVTDSMISPSSTFGEFAELFDAAGPKTNAEKALVAGYWLQVCQSAESFGGLAANTLLKHLGHAAPNITTAIDSLKNQKPSLALQLKKSGKSQQARKSYKITAAGIKAVEGMLNG